MTFEAFLKLIREHIGHYCGDQYWRWKYDHLEDRSEKAIRGELSLLAVNAIATHNSGNYI